MKVYCSCIQGDESFKNFSKLNISKISSAFSLFDSHLFPSLEDCLQEYGKNNLQTLISIYRSEKQVAFEDKTGVATLDIDKQGTKLYRVQSILKHAVFTLHVVLCSTSLRQHLQEVTCNSHLLTVSA